MRDHSMESLSDYIESLNVDEATRLELLRKLASMREKGLNIMITGATGSGKSSTINALFRADKARVGEGASPETQEIARYDYDGMTLWDTPGLGDGEDADKRHMEAIRRKLQETNNDGGQLIDAVLVVLDAGSRDLGSSYKLINEVVPARHEGRQSRCGSSQPGRHGAQGAPLERFYQPARCRSS